MAIGNRFFAKSFILLKNGQKLYLSNSLENLQEQIKNKKTIEVKTSNLSSRNYLVAVSNIELFGAV